jgi:hypothetical protein
MLERAAVADHRAANSSIWGMMSIMPHSIPETSGVPDNRHADGLVPAADLSRCIDKINI